ncbi:hypothetical protein ACFE04_017471 [Oxalis oulophora]
MSDSSLITCFIFFIFLTIFPLSAISVSFKISSFEPDDDKIVYKGDAHPEKGIVEMTSVNYISHVGQVIYADKVRLWDSRTGNMSNISTHFTFLVDTQGLNIYGHGIAFFFAPVGFQIPINSAGGLLGLFNLSASKLPEHEIVMVEFDTYNNPECDPSDVAGHVGINNNSIVSTVYTAWNVSFHSGDSVDVWITYDADTKNLSVKWAYQKTIIPQENSSISLKIDLKEVLPEWVTVGFSAATSSQVERHALSFWEFSSSLESDKTGLNRAKGLITIIIIVACSTVVIAVAASVIMKKIWLDGKSKSSDDTINLTSANFSELERITGPRRFSYEELETSHYGLVGWVWDHYGREQLHFAVDDKLKGVFDKNQAECLLIVGLWCAHPDFRQRATIRQAIYVLKFEAELPDLPPKIPVPMFQQSTPSYVLQPSNASVTDSSLIVGR